MINILKRLFRKRIVIKNGTIKSREKIKLITFDEIKKTEKDAHRILINGDIANVSITTSKQNYITAKIFGKCFSDVSGPVLSLIQNEKITKIEFQHFGKFYSGEVFLNITLPDTLHDLINVITTSGTITIDKSVNTRELLINAISGTTKVFTNCSNNIVKTVSGNVDFQLYANNNNFCKINTISGQVKLSMENIKEACLSLKSKSGKIDKKIDLKDKGYYANISIETISGNIKLENCEKSYNEKLLIDN